MIPKRKNSGFTLIELSIVIAILGLLAAVAVPSFIAQMYRARTAEIPIQMKAIRDGAKEYFVTRDETGSEGLRFPDSTAQTPAVSCCQVGGICNSKVDDWKFSKGWRQMNYVLAGDHYYRYEFISEGNGLDAKYTIIAEGDLDCDGVKSNYTQYGHISGKDRSIYTDPMESSRPFE